MVFYFEVNKYIFGQFRLFLAKIDDQFSNVSVQCLKVSFEVFLKYFQTAQPIN